MDVWPLRNVRYLPEEILIRQQQRVNQWNTRYQKDGSVMKPKQE
ncbi:hypothetical protein HMPREF1082_01163 [[Clostridium] clostridioforme 90A7]|nr:hypothetical protein HMPREF1082_01163 [[Clostridium] clostridioforme 90A7]